MKQLLYTLDEPYSYAHQLFAGVEYKNEWITIQCGALTVKARYSWDGCTPKRRPLGLFVIGTPDGAIHRGKPWMYYPSLVHDVLCQFRHELPFTQQEVTQVFRDHMQQVEWPLWRLYAAGVNYLGPQDFGPRTED